MLGRSRKRTQDLEQTVANLELALHEAKLEAVRWETLAEARRYEIERLQETLLRHSPIPERGGLYGGPVLPEPDPEPEQSGGIGLLERLDEICGAGLSIDEIERRHEAYRRNQLSELEEQRSEVRRELRELQELIPSG